MSLICGYNLESNPKATISWTDPRGNPVTISDNYTQDNGPEVVQLNITRVNKSDNGTWGCSMEVLGFCSHVCTDGKLLDCGQDKVVRRRNLKITLTVVGELSNCSGVARVWQSVALATPTCT